MTFRLIVLLVVGVGDYTPIESINLLYEGIDRYLGTMDRPRRQGAFSVTTPGSMDKKSSVRQSLAITILPPQSNHFSRRSFDKNAQA
jgi:hypothetical protein